MRTFFRRAFPDPWYQIQWIAILTIVGMIGAGWTGAFAMVLFSLAIILAFNVALR